MGQNRFRWPLKDDTAVYELQLTLYRHSATSNGCDEIPEHVVMSSKGCRSFPLAYFGAILTEDYER